MRWIISVLLCLTATLTPVFTSYASTPAITKQPFGETADGERIYLYTLKNPNGMQAEIMNYGGIMLLLRVPDRNGKLGDVLLGYADPMDYVRTGNKPYFGAIIGRYANRIANGTFVLDGTTYQLSVNEGRNTLAGGVRGFDKRVWEAEEIKAPHGSGLALRYWSKDGEEGFPGNVWAKVVYTLTDDNELRMDYSATSDQKTVINLTQHNYYNLKGQGNGDILDHLLTIHAERFTPVNPELIPTGQLQRVADTDLDFRRPVAIGSRIRSRDPQILYAKGYDFNYVLSGKVSTMRHAASVYAPASGRRMDVFTDQPGMQLYTGNFLDGSVKGKDGAVYGKHAGLCLETQHFPDSPNHPNFPSTVLAPDKPYKQTALFRFSASP